MQSELPPITAEQIRSAALSFPADTGLGADNLAPRALAALPLQQLAKLAHLFNECEAKGEWPDRWKLVLIVLLPTSLTAAPPPPR